MSRAAMDPVTPRLRARFEGLARQAPEAGAWLALVDAVLRESASGAWSPARAVLGSRDGPQLAGARLTVPSAVARRWVLQLLSVAGERGGTGLAAFRRRATAESIDPAALLEAAVRMDAGAVAALARGAGAEPQAFAQVAHLVVIPLLLALRTTGALRPPTTWSPATWSPATWSPATWKSGPCSACGAFALLAESRGLAREHHLRCGRCGADGAGAELTCVFCGNADHQRLRFLAPEGNPQVRRVLACLACRAYLRVIPTLEAIAPEALLLEDLAHVDLDLVGVEHGYQRPAAPVLAPVALVLEGER